MPKNIKEIRLWNDNPHQINTVPLVRIEFNFPCTWTILHGEDLKQILRLWIKGEKQKLGGKYKDAYWLRELIDNINLLFQSHKGSSIYQDQDFL